MRSLTSSLMVLLSIGILISCAPQADTDPPVLEITARDYSFHGVPDSLESGWTTFRFINEGQEPHFFLLDYPPEGKSLDDFMNEVVQPFDSVWYQLRDGEINRQQAGKLLGENLPAWYFETEQMGGAGMINPGDTTQTTLYLEPGTYIMECYVKTPEGEFHASVGMTDEFTVLGDSTRAEPPAADYEISLTNSEIAGEGSLEPGERTVAVHFEEHPEVGVGNDIHLARITEDTDMDSLKTWMDWMEVEGLMPPAPVDFLGGTQEMPVGYTSYFTVTLAPGQYVWLVETPGNVRAQTFTVGGAEGM